MAETPDNGHREPCFQAPWELIETSLQALLNMMTGLTLVMIGLILALISPALAAQPVAPEGGSDNHWLWITQLLSLLAIGVLLLIRKFRAPAAQGQSSEQKTSAVKRPELTIEPERRIGPQELARQLETRLKQCRSHQEDFGLICLALDNDIPNQAGYNRAALHETLASIARSRAVRLLAFDNGEFMIMAHGLLPDQVQTIAEDFREAVADLALSADKGLITASLGVYSGPVRQDSNPQGLVKAVHEQLEIARERGGNRVECRFD